MTQSFDYLEKRNWVNFVKMDYSPMKRLMQKIGYSEIHYLVNLRTKDLPMMDYSENLDLPNYGNLRTIDCLENSVNLQMTAIHYSVMMDCLGLQKKHYWANLRCSAIRKMGWKDLIGCYGYLAKQKTD
jgi:hypothetical protein